MEAKTDKVLFRVTIDVYENCQIMRTSGRDGEKQSIQNIIGVLEFQKMALGLQANSDNMRTWADNKDNLQKALKEVKRK